MAEGARLYRRTMVSAATLQLVQQMAAKDRRKPNKAAVERAVTQHPNFPRLYKEVSVLQGEYPQEVAALSRIILGISSPAFRGNNLVESHFQGAVRGPGNSKGIITMEQVLGQQDRMNQAREEFLEFAADRKIAWPSTPFEDGTNIEKYAPSDKSDVVAHGRKLWKEFGGNMLALGVGGSGNGPRVITQAFQLENAEHAGDTFASDHLRTVFKRALKTHGKPPHIIVTSLSGTTSETLSNFVASIVMLLQEAGIEQKDYHKYITCLTGGKGSKLREIADIYGLPTFYCKPNEGGRFSIWTVIGSLWAEANGVDSLEAKAGAMLSQYRILESDMKRNPAMMQAAIASSAQDMDITLFENLLFDETLMGYGNFFGQAWGESVESSGLGLRSRVDICPLWQHIGANGLLAVPKGVLAQLFWVKQSRNPITLNIPRELRHIQLGAGTLGDLQGKNLDDYQAGAVQGGWASFVGRGIPTTLTTIPQITPFTIGQMTQDTFGMVGYYGGSKGLGMKSYLQRWVLLHKDLGRGETDKVLTMPNGQECADALSFFEAFFA